MASPRSPLSPAERQPLAARRRKAYLVATYTGQLDAEDAAASWFCYDDQDAVHQALAELLAPAQQQRLRAVRDPPPEPGAGRRAPPAGATDEELEEMHGIANGWHTPTGPATSATVHVRLIGSLGESGQHTLSHYQPSDGGGVFKPGSIDEFAISCEDLGDIHTLEVWHDNDGDDLQASRWKLDKIVITCIQSTGAGAKGDFAQETKKTKDSDQWHFVLGNWLGCTPTDTTDTDEQLKEYELKIELLQIEVDKLRKAKRAVLGNTVQDCEHSRATISLNEVLAPAADATRSTAADGGSDYRPVACVMATLLLLLLGLMVIFSPGSPDEAPASPDSGVAPPPPLPVCDSEAVDVEQCDCELWAREEAAPVLLKGLCASTWDEMDRESTWEAAESHVRCTECCESVILPGGGFGTSGSSSGSGWVFTTLGLLLCAVVVAIACTCDQRDGWTRRNQLDTRLRASWQGARRRGPPRPGTVASPVSSSRRGRSRSPGGGRSGARSQSPGRSFVSVSRDSTYF